MASDQLARLLGEVSELADPIESLLALGRGSLEILAVDGVGVVAMTEDSHRVPVILSDDRAEVLERLQFSVAEGPCLDAFESGDPVTSSDLVADDRWPAMSVAAVAAGIGAVFAFPLKGRTAAVGTADFHRRTAGALDARQLTDGGEVADEMARLLLASTDGAAGASVPAGWDPSARHRHRVHQASGMISVQTGLPVAEALARLRAHAWVSDRPLEELAEDVVARRLRFEP